MGIWLKIRHSLALTILTNLTSLRPILKLIQKPFKADTIKNRFLTAGLVPFNPERVLGQLNIQLKTPTPPDSQSTNSELKTPHNLKQLEKQASIIKTLLRYCTQSPSSLTKTALNQLIKGCEVAINGGVLLTKENQDL